MYHSPIKHCKNCGAAVVYRVPDDGDTKERAVCPQCQTIHYENPLNVVGTVPHLGSMFTLFLNPETVTNCTVAVKSDTQRFARYFHAMLGQGIYLACSQYEANFVSAAHSEADLAATLAAAEIAFDAIKS